MVTIEKIRKSFGKNEVLKGVDIEFGQGKVTALLGPNGSGKTTLIKSLLGLVRPDSGKISVMGKSVLGTWDYRKNIGYMAQIARLPEYLTLDELLSMIRELRNSELDRSAELIKIFRVEEYLNRQLKTFSGGTRQKVSAIMALMFDSPILILDEPTTGLDPLSSRQLKDIVIEEKNRGKTVILTSHIMSEVEELADEIIFLLEGKIVFSGTPLELHERTGESDVERAISSLLLESKAVLS